MDDELLEKFISEYMESVTGPEVLFTWHGGETLLRKPSFYQKAIQLQAKYARGRQVDNCIQTNGTLLTPEWCTFFQQNNWLVGISLDGPEEFHDAYRITVQGKGSWKKVMEGVNLLNRYGVEWNALATVNRLNGSAPLEFYRFFKHIGCRFLQFTPVVERLTSHLDGRMLATANEQAPLADFSVTPEQWGDFTCRIFDEWVRNDVGSIFVQLFDSTLANWAGYPPGNCALSNQCGHAVVIEWNGDVYSCDHFVFPQYRLGNIKTQTLVEMMYSPRQKIFGQQKVQGLPKQCRQCTWLFACHGECPKNRFCKDRYEQPGLNYLCNGYRHFFSHVAPYMDFMKRQLQAGLPPASIMEWLERNEH